MIQPDKPQKQSSLKQKMDHLLLRWVVFSSLHPGKIVGGFLLLVVCAGLLAMRIHVDAGLESLLPQNSKTIQAMKETKLRYGSSDLFILSFIMKDPLEVAKIQDEISSEMVKNWPDVVSLQIDQDGSFFKEHALLYLPKEELRKLEDRLEAKRRDLKLGPLGVDLLSDAPANPPEQWFNANTTQQLGLPDEAADQFRKFLKIRNDSTTDSVDLKMLVDRKEGIPDSLKSRLIGRLDDGRYLGVVQAILNKPCSDVEYVKTVYSRAKIIMAGYERKYGDKIEIGTNGPYENLNSNAEALSLNGTTATVISILLSFIIVMAYFRTPGPLFLVLGQAALSCLFTLGFVSLSYGYLNLYTVFIIAVLFGMDVDFSLYFMGYAQQQVRKGLDWTTAIGKTFFDMSSSLFAAWITTVVGLLTLLFSRFAGFYQFGLIASVGVSISLVLTYLFLPSAILLVKKASSYKGLGWLRIEPKNIKPSVTKDPTWLPRFAVVTAAVAIIGAIMLIPFATRVQFEYDFTKLEESQKGFSKSLQRIILRLSGDSKVTLGKKNPPLPIDEALGTHRTLSQPVVLMVDSPVVLDEMYDTLQHRLNVDHDRQLSGFLTLRSFVPRQLDQVERLPYLRRINAIASDTVFSNASGNDSLMIAMIRTMSKVQPFTAEDLPSWALNLMRERDGRYGRIGFVYNKFNTSDAFEAQKYEDRYGHFNLKSGNVTCYSSSFVYADLVRLVHEDAVRMCAIMVLILCLLLGVILRKLKPVLVCIIGMIISLLWILGLMGLFHQKVNIFNLIVITTIQAVLTDVVIYMVLAWERQGRKGLRELYTGIGSLMSVAVGTTMAGYAGMLFTSHQGIQSIGAFATISLCACLFTSLSVTPWLCMRLLKNSSGRK